MDPLEVKQRMHSDAEQHECSSTTSEIIDSFNDANDSQKDEQRFGCGKCLKYFRESDRAKMCFYRHTAKHFKCDLCTVTFSNKEYLKDHMRSHTGEEFCICEWCGSTFGRKTHLERHLRIHTGEEPSIVTTCKVSALK